MFDAFRVIPSLDGMTVELSGTYKHTYSLHKEESIQASVSLMGLWQTAYLQALCSHKLISFCFSWKWQQDRERALKQQLSSINRAICSTILIQLWSSLETPDWDSLPVVKKLCLHNPWVMFLSGCCCLSQTFSSLCCFFFFFWVRLVVIQSLYCFSSLLNGTETVEWATKTCRAHKSGYKLW